jgi:hypothetical protein
MTEEVTVEELRLLAKVFDERRHIVEAEDEARAARLAVMARYFNKLADRLEREQEEAQ